MRNDNSMNDELPSSLDNFFILSKSAHIRVLPGWLLHHSRVLVFCWKWLSGCLRPVQGREGMTEKGRVESTALKFWWWQWNVAERGSTNLFFYRKQWRIWVGRECEERERDKKNKIPKGSQERSPGLEKEYKTEKLGWRIKNPRIFISLLYAPTLPVACDSPFSYNEPQIPPLCVCVCVCVRTGSLPSQLCPCARAISPSLTFTAQLPTDRPPLPHFVWMPVPLLLFAGPLKRREINVLSFFLLLHFRPSYPPKILPFLSRSRLTRFKIICIYTHVVHARFVCAAVHFCHCDQSY